MNDREFAVVCSALEEADLGCAEPFEMPVLTDVSGVRFGQCYFGDNQQYGVYIDLYGLGPRRAHEVRLVMKEHASVSGEEIATIKRILLEWAQDVVNQPAAA